eukprot:TRINITY_DN601_c0_g1_i1.p1 TRINITY_DN601_c0_g1~~TRINITY_DN601_c0_g1_i1.p1  ORF type:complete len:1211 (+),score=498.27 TRINITY_DN601_c0_g1_i1:82-3633(+)
MPQEAERAEPAAAPGEAEGAAPALTEERIERLKATFEAIDTNADGRLDLSEVKHLLRCTFPGTPEERVDEIADFVMRTADKNADGSIDWPEFLRSVTSGEGVLPAEVIVVDEETRRIRELLTDEEVDGLRYAFLALDQDGDGYLSMAELAKALDDEFERRFAGMRAETKQELVRLAMQNADRDHDGKLSLNEFTLSVGEGRGVIGADTVQNMVRAIRRRLADWEIDALRKTFAELDSNHDGFLDVDELRAQLDQLLIPRFPDKGPEEREEMIKLIVETADRDGDGRLSIAEFIRSFVEEQGVLPPEFILRHAPEGATILDPGQIAYCIEAFAALDKNGDGYIDMAELQDELRGVLGGMELSDEARAAQQENIIKLATRHVMEHSDADRDGRIDLKEFVRAFENTGGHGMLAEMAGGARQRAMQELADILEDEQMRRLHRVFSHLDRNHDGYLQRDELDKTMHKLLSERVPELRAAVQKRERVIDTILSAADTNHDGQISLDEFIRSYYESSGILPIDYVNELAEKVSLRLSKEEVENLKLAFAEIDQNQDGFVDRAELRALVLSILQQYVTLDAKLGRDGENWLDETVDLIMEATDVNADDKVSLSEFIRSFARENGVAVLLEQHAAAQQELAALRAYEAELAELRAMMTLESMRRMRKVFQSLDKNGDEFLDRDEVAKLMHRLLKERCPEFADDAAKRDQIIDVILRTADVDGDGRLSLDEFIQSFYNDCAVLPLDYVHEQADRVSKKLSKDEVNSLKHLFNDIDTNHDGKISIEELDGLLSTVVLPDDPETRAVIMQAIINCSDTDNDGCINLTEFIRSFAREEGVGAVIDAAAELAAVQREQREYVAGLQELHDLLTMEEMRRMARMFDHLDKNGDNFLDRDELQGVMHKLLKERCPEIASDTAKRDQAIDIILQNADINKDGRLSLEEFIQSFYSGCAVLPMEYVDQMADKVSRRLTKEEVATLKGMFKEIDTNSDGVITPEELDKQLSDLLAITDDDMRRELCHLIIRCSDKNADGKINLTEFIRAFARDEGIGRVLPHAMAERAQADSEVSGITAAAPPEAPAEAPAAATGPRAPVSEKALAQAAAVAQSPRHPCPHDVSLAPCTDDQLLQEFRKYDKDGTGWLSREEFKKEYMKMEWCGLEPSEREVDRLFSKFGRGDERLSYEEFCVLMLHRARI